LPYVVEFAVIESVLKFLCASGFRYSWLVFSLVDTQSSVRMKKKKKKTAAVSLKAENAKIHRLQ
jgi:hypothetical protein